MRDTLPAPGAQDAPAGWPARDGWRYGLLGLPLAFVALPLYVLLPHHYASAFGVPLASLGAVLLAARLLDAGVDFGSAQLVTALTIRHWAGSGSNGAAVASTVYESSVDGVTWKALPTPSVSVSPCSCRRWTWR